MSAAFLFDLVNLSLVNGSIGNRHRSFVIGVTGVTGVTGVIDHIMSGSNALTDDWRRICQ